jgi:transcriptional accessory protein Tex/SPT6
VLFLLSGSLAFLHKRKMKLNRRQRKYMPWEIIPQGSTVSAFVHSLDIARDRVSLTTFHPDEWDSMLPSKNQEEDYADDGNY